MKNFYKKRSHYNPQKGKNITVNYAPAKRKFPLFRWYLVLLIVSAPLIYFITLRVYEIVVITAPGYVTFNKITLSTPYQGHIKKLNVKPGTQVTSNEILAELENIEVTHEYQEVEKELSTIKNYRLKKPIIPDYLKKNLATAQQQLKYVEEQLKKYDTLQQEGAISTFELSQVKEQVANAKYKINDIQIQIEKEKKNQLMDLRNTNSYLRKEETLKRELRKLIALQKALMIRSPKTGKVIDTMAWEGEFLQAGDKILILATEVKPYISAYLDPKYAHYAQPQQTVTIQFKNGTKLSGTITQMPKLIRQLPNDVVTPIGLRDMNLYVKIMPDQPLPASLEVDNLPVIVRFHYL
ncbi:MAG: HlyD family secretion protein [Gammaproteobacteria bacterium]